MVVGVVVERLFISPLYSRIPLYSLLLTFGLSLIFEETFRLVWGPEFGAVLAAGESCRARCSSAGSSCRLFRLVIVGRLVVVMVPLLLFLYRTRLGSAAARRRARRRDDVRARNQYAGLVHARTSASAFCSPRRGRPRGGDARVVADDGQFAAHAGVHHRRYRRDGQPGRQRRRRAADRARISITTLYLPAVSEIVMYVFMALVLLVRPRGLFGEEGIFG